MFFGFALLQFLVILCFVYFNRNVPLEDFEEQERKVGLIQLIQIVATETFGPAYYGFYTLIGIFIVAATLLILFLATTAGRHVASEFLKGVEKGEIASVDIYLSDQQVKGHLINWLCNTTHCALLIEKQVVVYQRENIKRLVSLPALPALTTPPPIPGQPKGATPAPLPIK